MGFTFLAATAVLSFALSSLAATSVPVSKVCPAPGLCYQLNIPNNTASTGKGDIFFQIRASTNYEWAALGQGTQMQGANIFVMYQSADGKNVTVSPRYGVGHEEPLWDSRADLEVLAGSGVADGYMTANIRCGDCDRWGAGYMDFTAPQGNWIWSEKTGSPLQSNSVEAGISKHDRHGAFPWPWERAKGGNSTNPFQTADAVTTNAPASSEGVGNGFFGGADNFLIVIHGGMAVLAFVILFPIGGIIIRLANFRGGIWIHVGLQSLAWLIALFALILGIRIAVTDHLLVNAHPIIGIVLLLLILGQPVYGILHHRKFKRVGHRTVPSYLHLTIGRVAVFGGMINGGLGIMLVGDVPQRGIIAYSVISAVLGLLYIFAIVWGERRRKLTKMRATGFRVMDEPRGMDDQANLIPKTGDEGGLAQPSESTEMRPMWLAGHSRKSSEYAPLSVGEGYDEAGRSRPGSRAASLGPEARYSDRRTPSQDVKARVSMQ